MARSREARKSVEVSKALNRLPYLASPLLRFNLSDELLHLREEESWKRETGRSSKTLAKYPDFRIVLVLMKGNTQMNEHHADARISIHSLQGNIRIHLPNQKVDLPAGELMALDYGIRHDVEALEESAFLITISWPGGTKEERHAR
jgi:quercetin dioxygenase-like cupin family protein